MGPQKEVRHIVTLSEVLFYGKPMLNSIPGVRVTRSLETRTHTDRIRGSAWSMLRCFRRPLSWWLYKAFKLLYATLSTYIQGWMYSHVQPRSSKSWKGCSWLPRELSYGNRLQLTGLFPEAYRRARGDIICIQRIVQGELRLELLAEFPLVDCSWARVCAFTVQ